MLDIIFPVLGGLGVFLLGMIIMTDALKSLAGDSMRSMMMRFTRNASSGAVTGAITTAVLQSSSATTVAAVGFVGAGLLSFTESLGIIFGANIGTTLKGWLIVLVGFKMDLGELMMPVILVGAMLKLFANKKLASIGLALAGFGLVFVGISIMQSSMISLHDYVSPDVFPDDTWIGRIQLLFIGVMFTLVTQSSSAGVVMALTALFAGAINFEQAAAMVIGMDVGTTSTAALATIGGNVSSRRTGLSHVIYNMMTGVGAMLILSPYIKIWEEISPGSLYQNAELGLVAFHTLFNTLGVVIVLPFAKNFSTFIKKVIPEKESVYTAGLDQSLLKDNGMAITALTMSVQAEVIALMSHLKALLGDDEKGSLIDLEEMQRVLNKTHDFSEHIHIKDEKEKHRLKLMAMIHVLDHMQRLRERFEEDAERARTVLSMSSMDELRKELSNIMKKVVEQNEILLDEHILLRIENFLSVMTQQAENLRDETMSDIANGDLTVTDGNKQLEAIRWLRRVTIHVHKLMHHLEEIK